MAGAVTVKRLANAYPTPEGIQAGTAGRMVFFATSPKGSRSTKITNIIPAGLVSR